MSNCQTIRWSCVFQKPPGYHLDLFVLAVLIFVCSLLGLPWFVAATVRSITHVKSLFKQSEIKAPGERPSMLGVRLVFIVEHDSYFELKLLIDLLSRKCRAIHCIMLI